ncbi:MAG: peptidoglycan-binding protein, partial [Acidobacteriota bacterium]
GELPSGNAVFAAPEASADAVTTTVTETTPAATVLSGPVAEAAPADDGLATAAASLDQLAVDDGAAPILPEVQAAAVETPVAETAPGLGLVTTRAEGEIAPTALAATAAVELPVADAAVAPGDIALAPVPDAGLAEATASLDALALDGAMPALDATTLDAAAVTAGPVTATQSLDAAVTDASLPFETTALALDGAPIVAEPLAVDALAVPADGTLTTAVNALDTLTAADPLALATGTEGVLAATADPLALATGVDGALAADPLAALGATDATLAATAAGPIEIAQLNATGAQWNLGDQLANANTPLALGIGVSEGNRTVSGGFNDSYFGHLDPGNDARNLGSFSVQAATHGVSTPEEADRFWLGQLRNQVPRFESAANAAGLTCDAFNQTAAQFFDLYTQSPLAATASGGFLDQVRDLGAAPSPREIVEARVDSYYGPDGRLSAAGFDNNIGKVADDQVRRARAVNSVSSPALNGQLDTAAADIAFDHVRAGRAALQQPGRPERVGTTTANSRLQELLNANGANLIVDGDFGGGTTAAVQEFQRANSLIADGVVGAQTLQALENGAGIVPTPTPTPVPTPIPGDDPRAPQPGISPTFAEIQADPNVFMGVGQVGSSVDQVQQLLNGAGFTTPVSGTFDDPTRDSVNAFQLDQGLVAPPGLEGVVGRTTLDSLLEINGDVIPDPSIIDPRVPQAGEAPRLSQIRANPDLFIGEGQEGGSVVEIQDLLNRAGFPHTVTGTFGADTRAAVRELQRENGLVPPPSLEGVVGSNTLAQLELLAGQPPAVTDPRQPAPGAAPALDAVRAGGDVFLGQGQAGESVTQVQELLNRAGFDTRVNGRFDAPTKASVEQFQQAQGLIAPPGLEGVIGATSLTTLEQLADVTAPTGFTDGPALDAVRAGSTTLREFHQGDSVREVQQLLNRVGVPVGVDGQFGSNTKAAVERFQQREGLTPPAGLEGVVGGTTLARLEEVAANSSSRPGGFLHAPLGDLSTPITSLPNPNRVHPVLGTVRPHRGWDFGAAPGTPVLAATGGRISRGFQAGGAGNFITLNELDANGNETGLFTRYFHLQGFNVPEGAVVQPGQQIGTVGSTGIGTGPHLHFEVWRDGQWQQRTNGLFSPDVTNTLFRERPPATIDEVRAGSGFISQGDRTPAVSEIQDLLNRAGASITVDGDFGRGTRRAVEDFQRTNGLTVDGVVGRDTLALLERLANGG